MDSILKYLHDKIIPSYYRQISADRKMETEEDLILCFFLFLVDNCLYYDNELLRTGSILAEMTQIRIYTIYFLFSRSYYLCQVSYNTNRTFSD